MEIIVGRDEKTRKLRVNVDGKQGLYGQPNSVPLEVSRQHLSLTDKGDGKWKIKNLNDQNVTYVNGVAIESKAVSEKDKIELGSTRYVLQWSLFSLPKNEIVDIRPLKDVWEWYESTQIELKESERKIQNIQKLSGILSSCGILFMFAEGLGTLRFVLTGLSVLIGIILFVRGMSPDSSVNIKTIELGKEFRKKYICPKCGRFMGNEPYDVLIQNEACKFCKSKFKK